MRASRGLKGRFAIERTPETEKQATIACPAVRIKLAHKRILCFSNCSKPNGQASDIAWSRLGPSFRAVLLAVKNSSPFLSSGGERQFPSTARRERSCLCCLRASLGRSAAAAAPHKQGAPGYIRYPAGSSVVNCGGERGIQPHLLLRPAKCSLFSPAAVGDVTHHFFLRRHPFFSALCWSRKCRSMPPYISNTFFFF